MTATEIRRDVEGYSDMTEDAFARRFYADRAELDALGIHLRVDKPADGFSEQENYSLAPEAFHLPAIAFTDSERAALQTALTLLDGEFAYAEPLRLALQQITWGRPSPLGSDSRQTIGLGITASAGGSELSGRLAKVDTAIYRRKRIEFEYYTMQTDETAMRKVDPYHLLFEGGAVVPRRPLARARRRARVPAHAHPRQGRLLDQGRARLPAPRRLRPARRTPTGSRGSSATRSAPARSGSRTRSPGTSSASSAPTARWPTEDGDGQLFRTDYAISAAAGLLGAALRRARPDRRPAGARRGGARAHRRDHRAPPRRAVHRRSPPAARRPRRSPRPSAGAPLARRRGRHPPRALRAPGHARLRADRRRPRGPPPADRRGLRAAADLRAGAARGRLRAQRRQLRRRRLRDLRRGAPDAARSRSTPSRTRTRSTARPGCCRSRPTRSSRRST